ncbi:hypothetical protein D3C86_545890 [compost metagenome]
MEGISPWQAAAAEELSNDSIPQLLQKQIGTFTFTVLCSPSALYIKVQWPEESTVFRAAYCPGGKLKVKRKMIKENGITISMESVMGTFKSRIQIEDKDYPVLKFATMLVPDTDIHIPFWPKDIIIPVNRNQKKPHGTIHVKQVGTRSGILHFSFLKEKRGSVFYLQNLTSLQQYNQDTQTSAGETVGGLWPEIGFSLPPTTDFGLKKNTEYIISDAIVAFDGNTPESEAHLSEQYLNMLAAVYIEIPPRKTNYVHWPTILEKGLHDLTESPGCWCQVEGNHYFNAYVSDYDTPPEIMVQLAVLLPLMDYTRWSGRNLPVIKKIKDGLGEFYDEKLKTIVRWLPAAQDKLKGEEEQKKPDVMDSWYLHHPLLNLSRLSMLGDRAAEKLFLESLPYAIMVARHFKYNWPVFYNMSTLEVVKAETRPGEGGQHDVAGLYAHVLLQAYELTNDDKYLQEAEKAAKTLQGKRFKLFYQANNTAFSAGALLRLYKLTKNKTYLELSNLCMANIFQNVHLWDCHYGHGKGFPSFFALFPLSDAPYTAVYEEQEVFCAFHDYLKHAKGVKILPAIRLLISEYIRHLVDRAPFYYPPMLPDDLLSGEVKIGEVDRKLWIALEDLHDGWENSGKVGQEVYGAGNAFGILPRHYHKLDSGHMLFCDYPLTALRNTGQGNVELNIGGDHRITCRLRIIRDSETKLPAFKMKDAEGNALKSQKTREGHIEFLPLGGQRYLIES